MLPLLVSLALLLWSLPAAADEDDVQAWTLARLTHGLSDAWAVTAYARGRFDEDISHVRDYTLRSYLSWSAVEGVPFVDSLTVLAGYDRTKSYSGRDEHRAWQGALHAVDRGGFRFVHRMRLDERILDGVGPTLFRGRYRLSTTQQLFSSRFYASFRNEVFVNFNDGNEGPKDGFSQNRTRLGIGRKLSERLRADLGYEFHYVDQRGPLNSRRHVLFLELSLASGQRPDAIRSGTEARVEDSTTPTQP